jgi:iron complex transport system substrate-binding protein
MTPRAIITALLAAFALTAPAAAQPGPAAARPQRIVSMNLCTDELLMLIVPPERIVSISYLSHQPDSKPAWLAHIVDRIPANRGLAEEIIMMDPDLVIAGAFSTRPTVQLLRALGYQVADFAPEAGFDDMRASIRRMGEITGERTRAEALIAELDARLALLPGAPAADAPVFAEIGPNGVVSGADTLSAAVAHAAGLRTLGETLGFGGYRQVSLEQIVLSDPDVVAFGGAQQPAPALATEGAKHPALRRLAGRARQVNIPDRMWACAGPGALEAAEILAAASAQLPAGAE